VDVSAVRWEYDTVQLKPLWKVPNTYQSPGRARSNSQGNSQSNSRAGSVSPGARTTSSLIERLAQQDRYAATHGAAATAGESAGPTAVSFSFTARGKGAAMPMVQSSSSCNDNNDCISVASSVSAKTATTTASTATSSAKH